MTVGMEMIDVSQQPNLASGRDAEIAPGTRALPDIFRRRAFERLLYLLVNVSLRFRDITRSTAEAAMR